MYVLDKHVHALILLIISIVIDDFSEYVRVWRLILKKNTIILNLTLHSTLEAI